MTKSKNLIILSTLYLAQGLPYGFFTQALPVLLRTAGLSLPQIGLASFLTLPWALKFMWAPALDQYQFKNFGLRRSWLIPLQLLSVVLYIALGCLSLSSGELTLILVSFLVSNALAASQDIATDGLAVDALGPRDRGWANSVQVAGYRAGMIVGGLVLLAYYPVIGWRGVMFTMAGLALACTLPVLLYKEAPRYSLPDKIQNPALNAVRFYLNRGALKWGCVLLIYKFGHAAASAMIRPWLVDQSYSLPEIAQILGVGGFVAGFFGAVLGGYLGSRLSRARSLVSLGALQVLGLASYLWPLLTEHAAWKVVTASALDNFTSGVATTILFTVMMDACNRARSASEYTIQACTVVVSQSVAAAVAGVAAQAFGYPVFFAMAAAFGVVSLVVTAVLLRSRDVIALLDPNKSLHAA